MAITIVTQTEAVYIEEPLPPSMLVPTVELKRKSTGQNLVINKSDWKTELYPEEDFDLVAPAKKPVVEATVVERVTHYEASELATMGAKNLREIAAKMGIEHELLGDKQALVSAIVAKQHG